MKDSIQLDKPEQSSEIIDFTMRQSNEIIDDIMRRMGRDKLPKLRKHNNRKTTRGRKIRTIRTGYDTKGKVVTPFKVRLNGEWFLNNKIEVVKSERRNMSYRVRFR